MISPAGFVEGLKEKSYAEYNADPSRYPAYFDDYEDGQFTVKRYKQLELGELADPEIDDDAK